MPIPVSDRGANKYELIEHAAEVLSRSSHRKSIFTAIYKGKRRVKTVVDLMAVTGLPRNRVLDAGKQLASNDLVQKIRIGGITAYEKIDFFQEHRTKILRLAENDAARQKLPTKRKAQSLTDTVRVQLDLRVPTQRVKAAHITIDDIASFANARRIPRPTRFIKIPEKQFKLGVARILGENGDFKDWGGELSDLFSTNVMISRKRRVAAFAFKGPGTSGKLTPAKLGKNGDQIQRLLGCPAEVFIVQYWAEIDQSVLEQLEKLAQMKSFLEARQIWYGIIDGHDSGRLLKAYPEAFLDVNP